MTCQYAGCNKPQVPCGLGLCAEHAKQPMELEEHAARVHPRVYEPLLPPYEVGARYRTRAGQLVLFVEQDSEPPWEDGECPYLFRIPKGLTFSIGQRGTYMGPPHGLDIMARWDDVVPQDSGFPKCQSDQDVACPRIGIQQHEGRLLCSICYDQARLRGAAGHRFYDGELDHHRACHDQMAKDQPRWETSGTVSGQFHQESLKRWRQLNDALMAENQRVRGQLRASLFLGLVLLICCALLLIGLAGQ
jgi:hypothetical protein